MDFGAIEQKYGLPAGYLGRTATIESGNNPNARNPNSSAGGLFQFIDSTAAQYGLTDRFNPVAATDAAARLARDNAARLRAVLGREPTGAELYLAHQQGGGGATALLRNPNARAVDVVGPDAIRLNGGRMDMTAGEFAGLWMNKFDNQSGSASAPPAASATDAPTDYTRLAYIYANGGMTPEDEAIYERGMRDGVFPRADRTPPEPEAPPRPDRINPLDVYRSVAGQSRVAQLPVFQPFQVRGL